MSDDRTNHLLDAVDALTKVRKVHTTIQDDDTGEWLGIHTEEHPALLTLLVTGLGMPNRSGSSDIKIPIDAEALELWAQVRDLIRLWCKKLHAPFGEDLPASVRVWFLAHTNAVRAGRVSAEVDSDVTRMVEGWVRMIENKFDPPEKREWENHCVAEIHYTDADGAIQSRRCGARRINLGGKEEFAIALNVTTLVAECRECRTKWIGEKQLRELRFLTNLDVSIREGKDLDPAALAVLAK